MKKTEWPSAVEVTLSPEQIILWLDGYRQLMFEVWAKNPDLREQWERKNAESIAKRRRS